MQKVVGDSTINNSGGGGGGSLLALGLSPLPQALDNKQGEGEGSINGDSKAAIPALPHLTADETKAVLCQLHKTVPDASDALFLEYTRFLYLRTRNPSDIVPSVPIDGMWHAHILCSKDYEAWCARFNGGAILHHNPGTGDAEKYANAFRLYREAFGTDPPAAHWPARPNLQTRAEIETDETAAMAAATQKEQDWALYSDLLQSCNSQDLLPSLSKEEISAVLKEFRKKKKGPDVAPDSSLLIEYTRFLALALRKLRPVPSLSVDFVWHAHLLCTRSYESWCARCNCGEMLHHHPGIGGEDMYMSTLQSYEEVFQLAPPEIIWPRPRSYVSLVSSPLPTKQPRDVLVESSAIAQDAPLADSSIISSDGAASLLFSLKKAAASLLFSLKKAAAMSPTTMPDVCPAAFLSHFQSTGGDQCLLLREALAASGYWAWYDQDITNLSTASMSAGAKSAPLFVLLLSRGVLTRWAVVENEIAVAIKHWREKVGEQSWASHICFVVEDDVELGGATVGEIIEEGSSPVKRSDIDGGARLCSADLEALFPNGKPVTEPIVFHRGEGLLTKTIPALMRRIAEAGGVRSITIPRPMKLRNARLKSDEEAHVLVAGTKMAANQADFVRLALETMHSPLELIGKSRLVVRNLIVDNAVCCETISARLLVVILTSDIWSDALVCQTLKRALDNKTQIFLLHEMDGRHGGVFPINTLVDNVPSELQRVFWDCLAHTYDRQIDKRKLWLSKLCIAAGLEATGLGPLAPPPIPPLFSLDACRSALQGIVSALTNTTPDGSTVVVTGGLGGMGKTAVAIAATWEPEVQDFFEEVLWVTIGRSSGSSQVTAAISALLRELNDGENEIKRTDVGSDGSSLNVLVDELRGVLERRRVLVVFDDLAGSLSAASAHVRAARETHFVAMARLAPTQGGSRILVTTRDLVECGATCSEHQLRFSTHPLQELSPEDALGLLSRTAGLVSLLTTSPSSAASLSLISSLARLTEATGRSPLALQVTAGALRCELEHPNSSGQTDVQYAAEQADSLALRLTTAPLPEILLKPNKRLYSSVFRAIAAMLSLGFAPSDIYKFATFGLFIEDAHVPLNLLRIAWRMDDEQNYPRFQGFIAALAAASLLKHGRPGCVQLHDLPWGYAQALIGGPRQMAAAHATLLARVRTSPIKLSNTFHDLFETFRAPVLMRDAGDIDGSRSLTLSLHWLMGVIDARGADEAIAAAELQAKWEMVQTGGTDEAAVLHQLLLWSVSALIHRGGAALPPQICSLAENMRAGRPSLQKLWEEARRWTAEKQSLGPISGTLLHSSACTVALNQSAHKLFLHPKDNDSVYFTRDYSSFGFWGSYRSDCRFDVATGKVYEVIDAKNYSVPLYLSSGRFIRFEFETRNVIKIREIKRVGAREEATDLFITNQTKTTELGLFRRACELANNQVVVSTSSGLFLLVFEGNNATIGGEFTQFEVDLWCSLGIGKSGFIASSSRSYTLFVWNSFHEIPQRFQSPSFYKFTCVKLLDDGRIVTAGHHDTFCALVWDVRNGSSIVLAGHSGSIMCLCAISGGRVVTGSNDKTLRVWTPIRGSDTEYDFITLSGHVSSVEAVCMVATSNRIVSGENGGYGEIRIWIPESGVCERVIKSPNTDVYFGYSERYISLVPLADGRIMVSRTRDCFMLLNPFAGGLEATLDVLPKRHTTEWLKKYDGDEDNLDLKVLPLCALSDGNFISISDNEVFKWDATSGECKVRQFPSIYGTAKMIVPLSDGRIVAYADRLYILTEDNYTSFSYVTLELDHNPKKEKPNPFDFIIELCDGQRIAAHRCVNQENYWFVWDVDSGECLTREVLLPGTRPSFLDLAPHPHKLSKTTNDSIQLSRCCTLCSAKDPELVCSFCVDFFECTHCNSQTLSGLNSGEYQQFNPEMATSIVGKDLCISCVRIDNSVALGLSDGRVVINEVMGLPAPVAGDVPALARALRARGVLERTVYLLCSCARHRPSENSEALRPAMCEAISLVGIPSLISIITDPRSFANIYMMKAAVRALCFLARSFGGNWEIIISNGGVSAVVLVLKSYYEDVAVCEACIEIISVLADYNDIHREIIRSGSVISILEALVSTHEGKSIATMATGVLASLLNDSKTTVRELSESSFVEIADRDTATPLRNDGTADFGLLIQGNISTWRAANPNVRAANLFGRKDLGFDDAKSLEGVAALSLGTGGIRLLHEGGKHFGSVVALSIRLNDSVQEIFRKEEVKEREVKIGIISNFIQTHKIGNPTVAEVIALWERMMRDGSIVDINISDPSNNFTALTYQASQGTKEAMEWLLTRQPPADPNLTDCGGHTALWYAVFCDDPEKVRLLLEHGADRDKDSIQYVSRPNRRHGNKGVIPTLEGYFPETGRTKAAAFIQNKGDLPSMERMLGDGSVTDINVRFWCNDNYVTALMYQSSQENAETTIEWLLTRHPAADINLQDVNGKTALNLAVCNNRINNVRVLVKYGANPAISDYSFRTPLQYSLSLECDSEISKLLAAYCVSFLTKEAVFSHMPSLQSLSFGFCFGLDSLLYSLSALSSCNDRPILCASICEQVYNHYLRSRLGYGEKHIVSEDFLLYYCLCQFSPMLFTSFVMHKHNERTRMAMLRVILKIFELGFFLSEDGSKLYYPEVNSKSIIFEMLTTTEDALLVEVGCGALGWLAKDVDFCKEALDSGAITAIMDALRMNSSNKQICNSSCYALRSILLGLGLTSPWSSHYLLSVVPNNGIGLIVTALLSHSNDKDSMRLLYKGVCFNTLFLLGLLAASPACFREVTSSNVFDAVNQKLDFFAISSTGTYPNPPTNEVYLVWKEALNNPDVKKVFYNLDNIVNPKCGSSVCC